AVGIAPTSSVPAGAAVGGADAPPAPHRLPGPVAAAGVVRPPGPRGRGRWRPCRRGSAEGAGVGQPGRGAVADAPRIAQSPGPGNPVRADRPALAPGRGFLPPG